MIGSPYSAASARATLWVALTFALAAILLTTQPAHAHIQGGEASGFLAGLKHPWSGWDHICAMIAVGLWGAQLGKPAIWLLPVTFPLVMAVGGFMGIMGYPLPGVEYGIAASAILLGIMVLLAARPPLSVAAAIVGIFGLFHGHAHGHELKGDDNAILYSIGFVVATGTLHACGIGIGALHFWKPGKIILRGAGAAIAIAGIIFLIQAFQGEPAVPASAPAKPASSLLPFYTLDHTIHHT